MAKHDDDRQNVFLVLWTLSVIASAICLLFYLGVRVKTMELGYELGKAQSELSRLREVERVLRLEASAQETPERVDRIGRTLFGMEEPSPDRVIPLGPDPAQVAEPSDEKASRPRVAEGVVR